ncbi:broad-complex core protein isoforms 1/2/3/4/5-like isoform X5 [Zootermopsis nevadensis]|uniref:broad-complex core protein isoforms 1/2/3/4/5-like isoform X5 n=1 Tax=Zootermopsis nevadensis TaxID=136037 RepID=UPI000B8E399C|nr:broad-complex core protein isoforms 1/2/3/4/5-like isoform X5 [Zootermopsis nevadensis]XP_021914813.1 broad-complex core protein isoforms 1/2/3/4/5-like isoform X5 [Zootermopsis nevadensis]
MGETDGEQFSLRWNNFHNNLTAGFHALLQEEDLVDVTLAAGGQFVHAHKIVLSVCSPYFKELFKVNPCKHPIVILKDVGHKELVAILQFMYQGEVNVQQEDLATFLKTAELLQIKGLTENDSPATNTPPSVPDTSETTPASRTTQPSLPEPPVVQSEDTPVHPYKRMRSETPAPSSTSVSSPCTVNEDTGGVEIVEMSKPKIEPVDYESDLEEVGRLPSHDDPLAQLLGGESSSHSHQDSAQGTVPIFASIPGLSQDSGSSQDGGQGWLYSAVYIMECPLCSRGFRNKFNLKVHMRDVHGDDQGPFFCPHCGKQVKNKSCLRVHQYRHHQAPKNILHSPVTMHKTQQ